MEIDALKERFSQLHAPENMASSVTRENHDSSTLTSRLKRADQKSKVFLQRFYLAYFSIAAIYFAIFILNPDPDLKLNDRINGALLFIGIMLFAILAKRKHFKFNKIEYDQATTVFLNEALARYKFWTTEMNYVAFGVIIVNVGSCRSYLLHYPQFDNILMDILLFETVFLFMLAIGLFFGIRHWNAHKKPIYLEIKKLLQAEA